MSRIGKQLQDLCDEFVQAMASRHIGATIRINLWLRIIEAIANRYVRYSSFTQPDMTDTDHKGGIVSTVVATYLVTMEQNDPVSVAYRSISSESKITI